MNDIYLSLKNKNLEDVSFWSKIWRVRYYVWGTQFKLLRSIEILINIINIIVNILNKWVYCASANTKVWYMHCTNLDWKVQSRSVRENYTRFSLLERSFIRRFSEDVFCDKCLYFPVPEANSLRFSNIRPFLLSATSSPSDVLCHL